MSESPTGSQPPDLNTRNGRAAIARHAADYLGLAAAPVFALMALLTAISGGPADLCTAAGGMSLSGMTLMYLLMSVFHLGQWLRLAGRHR